MPVAANGDGDLQSISEIDAAAYGCGVGDLAGSLEIGKKADILIVDADDYRQIAFEFGGNSVSKIFKYGEVVV